jgi:hypothetical protein
MSHSKQNPFENQYYDDENSLYNRYTEVFTKDSKRQQQVNESVFSSGGMLEIINQRNSIVVLNLDNFVYLASEHVAQMIAQPELLKKNLTPGTEICFRVTEPCL